MRFTHFLHYIQDAPAVQMGQRAAVLLLACLASTGAVLCLVPMRLMLRIWQGRGRPWRPALLEATEAACLLTFALAVGILTHDQHFPLGIRLLGMSFTNLAEYAVLQHVLLRPLLTHRHHTSLRLCASSSISSGLLVAAAASLLHTPQADIWLRLQASLVPALS